MASIDFRQNSTTTYRSSADAAFASRRLDAPVRSKPDLLGLALFYGLVIAVIAIRVIAFYPSVGQ
jgi:hypothetical protein